MLPNPQWRGLASGILCAAKITFPPNCWKAFIGIVEGRCHDKEVNDVFEWGTMLDESVARVLFPDFATLPYDR